MQRLILLVIAAFTVNNICSQDIKLLKFQPVYHGKILRLNDLQDGGITITSFKFYVSGIHLQKNKATVWKEEMGYHLVNVEVDNSLYIELKLPLGLDYDQILFNVGVDSATNAAGAGANDLDPTKGMYWSWQSGYINFKLEGTSPECKTRNHEFAFHLGGFRTNQYCMQTIMLPVNSLSKDILVIADAGKFLQNIELSTQNHLMIPGQSAIELSKKTSGIYSIADHP